MIAPVLQAASVIGSRRRGAARKANINRVQPKESWSNWYLNWDDSEFKSRVRVHRDTFEFILGKISPFIAMTPTNFVPIPIELHRQLGLTLYRRVMDVRNENKEEEVTHNQSRFMSVF